MTPTGVSGTIRPWKRLRGCMRKSLSLIYVQYIQPFLGQADVKTPMEWSDYLLGETPALDMADFALPINRKAVAEHKGNPNKSK